jgi:hypothetical protein
MTGTRTFYGNVPASYRSWWLEHAYPVHAAKLEGDTTGGCILSQPIDSDTIELKRLRRFGATWSWWSVPEHSRSYWWSFDG